MLFIFIGINVLKKTGLSNSTSKNIWFHIKCIFNILLAQKKLISFLPLTCIL